MGLVGQWRDLRNGLEPEYPCFEGCERGQDRCFTRKDTQVRRLDADNGSMNAFWSNRFAKSTSRICPYREQHAGDDAHGPSMICRNPISGLPGRARPTRLEAQHGCRVHAKRGSLYFPIAIPSEANGAIFQSVSCETSQSAEVCIVVWLHGRAGGVLIVEMVQRWVWCATQ